MSGPATASADPAPRPAAGRGSGAARAWVVLALMGAAAVVAIALAAPSGFFELPLAHRGTRVRTVLAGWSDADVRRVRTLLDLEYGVIALAVGLLTTACFWRAGVEPRGVRHDGAWHRPALLAGVAVVAGGCDVAENVLLERTITAFRRTGALGPDPDWTFAVAAVKWAALAVVVASLLRLVPQRLPPPVGGARFRASTSRPEFLRPAGAAHPWEPPDAAPRIGVCCSGGGLRSASFSLGAVQQLQQHGVLRRARYLAAVSGGCYLATGLATARPAPDPDPTGPTGPTVERGPEAFGAGSPEERWLRANSSYLAPDRRTLVAGLARLLGGVGVNLVLIWLLLFAVARPAGWLMSADALHPELRAREPFITVDAPLVTDGRRLLPLGTAPADPATAAARAAGGEIVPVLELSVTWDELPVRLEGREVPTTAARLPIVQTRTGVVAVQDGRLRVVRQPRVAADNGQLVARWNADGRDPVQIGRQPSFGFDDDATFDAATIEALLSGTAPPATLDVLADRLELQRPPALRLLEGMDGRPPLRVDRWMVTVPAGLALASAALYLGRLLRRDERWPFGRLHLVLAVGAIAAALLLVVLPAAVVGVPRALAWLAGLVGGGSSRPASSGSGWADVLPGVLGFAVTAAAAVRTYLQRRSAETGRLRRTLRWAAGFVVPVVAALLFVDLLQMAAANGPFGHLSGFGLGLVDVPDLVRWLAVLAGLAVLWRVADAHAWSMYPFYKERLQAAYVLERRGASVAPIPFAEGVWFSTHPHVGADRGEPGPQLVVCAAANLSEPGRVPPGRRCVSFTFSPAEVGGPQVGYVPTAALEDAMGDGRRRDLTMVAAMAISGAAVSPAMGKLGIGPLGRLFAVLNLRLGVWLPHPEWVDRFLAVERGAPTDTAPTHTVPTDTVPTDTVPTDTVPTDTVPTGSLPPGPPPGSPARPDRGPRWTDRPGWPYFLREVLGRFRFADRYLYVSDGGHWENLGLVELLRRGCTDVYCISAAGDGPTSFSTIAEAIGLAREELGVEIDIELSDLRPVDPDDPAPSPDPARTVLPALRRGRRVLLGAAVAPRRFAARPYAVGRIRYPAGARHDGRAVEGRLVVIEANLTDRIPWDVQGFAESTVRFPDESTGDQFFDHRQFEAYRRLGEYQMGAALRALPTLGSGAEHAGDAGLDLRAAAPAPPAGRPGAAHRRT